MGGFDDHVGIMGDWMPPSPSPRTFFSAMLGDGVGSRSITEPNRENESRTLFPGHEEQIKSANTDDKNGGQSFISGGQANKLGAFSEQKMSSGRGLLERMAARAGFNAPRLNTESIRSSDLSHNPEVRSPYLTIPPGLSPTSLLDSPVFLSNSQVLPSPTTGKFPWALGGSNFTTEAADKSRDNFFENINSSSFAFKPQTDFCRSSAEKDNGGDNISSEPRAFDTIGGSAEQSPPLNEQQDGAAYHRGGGDPNLGGATSEDGYNWRKYGQKQVKGSEYPRSYYKCTHPNCPVKKKVERSHEGHITEIIYKGAHNHPKPPPNRRLGFGSSNALSDMQVDISEQDRRGANGAMQQGNTGGAADWRHDNLEVASSAPMGSEYCDASTSLQNGTKFESGDAVDDSSTFSNDEDEDDRGTHGSVSLGYDGEGDESESKRRKIEAYATEMSGATRSIREPRVVVQTTSDVDILDDGYRWRKYGQKVVKGNPNPRSYYKCTSAGCTVRKHVERASHDLKSVITTYEGKHNHDVPAARNSSHVNSGVSNSLPTQSAAAASSHVPRPEPSQVYNSMARFERPPSFGLPGRQQMGPSHGFSFGMNQPGLAHLGMAGFGSNQGKLPVLPVHPYLEQPRPMNEMGFMLPKEPKMEPMSEPGLNLSNSSLVYHQIMSRLPLGP